VIRRTFTYEQAAELFPEVQRLTDEAVGEIDALEESDEQSPDVYQRIVERWAEAIMEMGIEVKGLWLIDFDSGSGYYCWHHPEPSLQYFHGYDEGFPGRVKLQ
jgi:hypothetical protein